MIFCEYGCGKQAKYQLKNNKWCCSKYHTQCIINREKNSNNQKGKLKHTKESKKRIGDTHKGTIHSVETKNKMSNSHKGKILSEDHKKNISKSNKGKNHHFYGKTFSEEHKKHLSKSHIGIKPSKKTRQKISNAIKGKKHPNYGKTFSNSTIKKMSKSHQGQGKRTINYIKKMYPTFAKVEEMRYNPDKPDEKEIQVHCKNHKCKNSKEQGGWFTPTGRQIESRISNINRDGSNFYCSNDCKHKCPIYGKKAISLIKQDQINVGHIKKELYTSEEYQTWRTTVMEREDYKCEYCEIKAIHVHHSRPQKLEPGFVLDPDFGVACCRECHYKYGHKTGIECSTGNLASIICR